MIEMVIAMAVGTLIRMIRMISMGNSSNCNSWRSHSSHSSLIRTLVLIMGRTQAVMMMMKRNHEEHLIPFPRCSAHFTPFPFVESLFFLSLFLLFISLFEDRWMFTLISWRGRRREAHERRRRKNWREQKRTTRDDDEEWEQFLSHTYSLWKTKVLLLSDSPFLFQKESLS